MGLLDLSSKYRRGVISKSDYIFQMNELHKQLFEYSHFIKNTDISSIQIINDRIEITSRNTGIRMLCTHPDQRIAPFEILNFGFLEECVLSILFKLIKPDFTIFDIGANVGWYTLNISKMYPDTKILSFEPIPQTFKELEINLELNKLKNVQIYNFGFSNREETATFYVDPKESVSASLRNITGSDNVKEITCNVKILDKYFEENDIKKLDFIKCDVEGAELLVFQGGIKTIDKYQPMILAEMLRKWSAKFHYHPNDIIKLLSQIGYRCFEVNNDRLIELFNMDDNTIETNFLFLHSDKHSVEIESLVIR